MQLTEIIEQLAQSCTFTTITGRLTQVEDANRVVLAQVQSLTQSTELSDSLVRAAWVRFTKLTM